MPFQSCLADWFQRVMTMLRRQIHSAFSVGGLGFISLFPKAIPVATTRRAASHGAISNGEFSTSFWESSELKNFLNQLSQRASIFGFGISPKGSFIATRWHIAAANISAKL